MIYIIFLLITSTSYLESDYVKKIVESKTTEIDSNFNEAIKKYPNSYQIYLNTGFTHLKYKNYEKAYSYYSKAYEIYPDLNSLYGITYTLLELGRYQEVIDRVGSIKQVDLLKIAKNDKFIILRLSFSYLMLKKYQKSVEISSLGLKLYPKFNSLRLNQAYSLYYLEKKSESLKEFKKIKSIDSNFKTEEINKMINLLDENHFIFNIFPYYGAISFNNHPDKTGYSYFGVGTKFGYNNFNINFEYTQINIKDFTENDFGAGIGYNSSNFSTNIHFKYIDFSLGGGNIPYIDFSYKFNYFKITNSLAISLYENLSTIYQDTIYLSLTNLLSGKFIPWITLGYKYSKLSSSKNSFFGAGAYFDISKFIDIKVDFRYNEGYYFVDYGGEITSNIDESINWRLILSLPIKFYDFSLVPEFNYSQLKSTGTQNGKKKPAMLNYTISLGYNF